MAAPEPAARANLFDIDQMQDVRANCGRAPIMIYPDMRFRGSSGRPDFDRWWAARATRANSKQIDWQASAAPQHRPTASMVRVFDNMLNENLRAIIAAGCRAQAGRPPARPFAGSQQATTRTPPVLPVEKWKMDSAAARWLNEHFGGNCGARCHAKTEGDEAIVLGKLAFGRENAAVGTRDSAAPRSAAMQSPTSSSGLRLKIGGRGPRRDDAKPFGARPKVRSCVDHLSRFGWVNSNQYYQENPTSVGLIIFGPPQRCPFSEKATFRASAVDARRKRYAATATATSFFTYHTPVIANA